MEGEYQLFVRNQDLERISQIDEYEDLTLTLPFADVGTWVLDLDLDVAAAAGLDYGTRLEVQRGTEPLISGPVDDRDRTMDADGSRLTVSGSSDLSWLQERLAMPRPANPWTSDQQGIFEVDEITYDVREGVAETVIHEYVDANAGPGARLERRVPGLVLGADLGRGNVIIGRARFQTVLEVIRDAGFASGRDFGFRIAQIGNELEFSVLEGLDQGLVFSEDLGNLAAFHHQSSRPSASALLIGGGTPPGNSRRLYERLDPHAILGFGRIEKFIDKSDSVSSVELDQIAAQEMGQPILLELSPAAVEGVSFGVDYDLGDVVTVIVDGSPIRQVLRELRITVSDQGETITPIVGTPGISGDPEIFSEVRRIERRVRGIQRLASVEGTL